MGITRREWIAAAAASTAAAQRPPEPPPRPRAAPMICLFSKHLPKLHYSELPMVVKTMGFEGCDLTVRAGGHVLPERAPADLFRAVESLRGEGVEVPIFTTAFTSANDPFARNVLAIGGGMGVPFFKPGYWSWNGAVDPEVRLAEVKRDLAGLSMLARGYRIAMGIHNHSGDRVGEALWDTRSLISDLDPRYVGYYYDPCHATIEGGLGGWTASLRMALPRLKMVALKDFYWAKEGGKWQVKMCPMGEGMVDWQKFFSILAQARFTGPMSLHVEYNPASEIAAIGRDLEFVKKQVAAAFPGTAS